jgi:RNA polymerase sigma factor (sigma-70 family)
VSAEIEKTIGHLFRHEAGKMAAVLARIIGPQSLDEVDDIVQDTLLKALEVWKFKGIPQNPSAWLYKVARNKAIDKIRARKHHQRLSAENDQDFAEEFIQDHWENNIDDSVLRMMFACCHPAIAIESQIAFTLKTLGGLSVKEIASAFLTSEDTIAKRIYRAKEKFRDKRIDLTPPAVFELPSRLESVLKVLYLLFNEGYYSSNPELVIREDLCAEAMRLTYLVVRHPQTSLPQAKALLALMCLHASRFPARADDQDQIVLLEHQDRNKWNQDLIQRGLHWLELASVGDWLTEYHVEAAIASVHALAETFAQTDWNKLLQLYDTLHTLNPSQSTLLNKAIVTGYAQSPAAGFKALSNIAGLEQNQYYHVALGDCLVQLNRLEEARRHFNDAIQLTASAAGKQLVQTKLSRLTSA